MASPEAPSRPATPTPSQLPPVPSSPVYSIASTANPVSQFNLPPPPVPRPAHAVLKQADLERSQDAYADLVASAKAYRLALASLSTAASGFGSALEACARLKEARAEPIGPVGGAMGMGGATSMTASFTTARGACTADTLLAAAGVHHLVANHQQILSETVYRAFEVPLLHDLDRWRTVMDDEAAVYQDRIRAQAREVKRLEKEGLKLHRQRRRDVARFRAHLVELTGKLDGLTTLHADHARTLLRESQETSARIVDASCSLVRAEVDIFESLARKGWSGGGLDDLLEKGQDLFATDDAGGHAGAGPVAAPGEAATLFSILPPKSILADSALSSDAASRPGHGRADSLLTVDGDRYQSLVAVAARSKSSPGGGADSDSVFSADFNRPRNARPFSPQPIRRVTTDVTFDSLGAMAPPPPPRNDDDDGDAPGSNEGGPPVDDADDGQGDARVWQELEPQQGEGAEAEAESDRGRRRSESPSARSLTSSPEDLADESPSAAVLPNGDDE